MCYNRRNEICKGAVPMKDTVIFCWSGTGNCLDMAKNIAKALGGADIISVRKKPEVTDVRSARRVGFVFPCHGGGAPVDFLENVKGLQIDKGSYVFAVSQSASYPGTGRASLQKDREGHSGAEALQEGSRRVLPQRRREQGLADDPQAQGQAVQGQREVHRLRPVREDLPAREHRDQKRQGLHRPQLRRLPRLPAVLPDQGDLPRQGHRPPRALHEPQRHGRGADERTAAYLKKPKESLLRAGSLFLCVNVT